MRERMDGLDREYAFNSAVLRVALVVLAGLVGGVALMIALGLWFGWR